LVLGSSILVSKKWAPRTPNRLSPFFYFGIHPSLGLLTGVFPIFPFLRSLSSRFVFSCNPPFRKMLPESFSIACPRVYEAMIFLRAPPRHPDEAPIMQCLPGLQSLPFFGCSTNSAPNPHNRYAGSSLTSFPVQQFQPLQEHKAMLISVFGLLSSSLPPPLFHCRYLLIFHFFLFCCGFPPFLPLSYSISTVSPFASANRRCYPI